MVLLSAVLITLGTLVFTLLVRSRDIPEAPPVSPVLHLEERKAQIYENLRDLQFEYRVGKLSDEDYQKTKLGLQRELAKVLAEIESISITVGQASSPVSPLQVPPRRTDNKTCPHCAARFPRPMKFCGECGKAMS
jgi:hypothetical protein